MSLPFHSLDAALMPSPASAEIGLLPEWRLEDLYDSMDSPRFAADLARAEREAKLLANASIGRIRARRLPARSALTSRCRI